MSNKTRCMWYYNVIKVYILIHRQDELEKKMEDADIENMRK